MRSALGVTLIVGEQARLVTVQPPLDDRRADHEGEAHAPDAEQSLLDLAGRAAKRCARNWRNVLAPSCAMCVARIARTPGTVSLPAGGTVKEMRSLVSLPRLRRLMDRNSSEERGMGAVLSHEKAIGAPASRLRDIAWTDQGMTDG